ncbi:aldehyde dehydrogenase [Iodidimonas nitroreducens]|uniref:aldehyde dehydrogenase (NAD(+)) n=1 Tax=Iodidimonas nitroreducens TaxID=1236968 RepID=A0A5A7N6N5_9PROT|nr:aldehyde dehydrogenase family protein [Iodidimonas nitroreducens]GAK33726.1 hypothetical protein AQ1_01616 [alpha proteobacterium Q-1]GER03971.1 aldehyde dehydrogenase [Iodidimonas nitroreducens]
MTIKELFSSLHLGPLDHSGDQAGTLAVTSPIDGSLIGHVKMDSPQSVAEKVGKAVEAFAIWRQMPGPQRGELVRLLGEELRAHKDALGRLVSVENGKILEEGKGEVQEMIDICDFAVGLSRQLYGLTIASERPGHAMRENWQPLGPVGVISAFNFPVAVWSWNTALALVCGDPVLWKPSEKTPFTALACQALFLRAAAKFGAAPDGLSQIVIGAADIGEALVDDPRVPLISATGSCAMGRKVAPRVASRFGRCLLELGGNNAIIVAPSADLDLAVRAIVFGAVGTAGQRCTSTRRLIIHRSIYDDLMPRLKAAFERVTVGNPLEGALVGPLIDEAALNAMDKALERARAEGGVVEGGGRVLADRYPDAFYARPAIVEMPAQKGVMMDETFAPILYAVKYDDFDAAIALQNAVSQGLSSALFSNDVREAELYLSATGSDCGIANINIGTSGAEIGGAFGGEKETGGGRESGSDAWRVYMRRQTSTVNYSTQLPLAQGISFEL